MEDKVKEKLQALFLEYSKNLPLKIQRIEKEWLTLSRHFNVAEFKTFHRDVHSLCGSAGTYGYTRLSTIARQLEILLKSLLSHTTLTEEQQVEIDRLVNELKAAGSLPPPKEMPIYSTPAAASSTNKLVYIIDDDRDFINELNMNLEQVGYKLQSITHLDALQQAVKQNPPVAIIMNTQHFAAKDVEAIKAIEQQIESIPLFCMIDNNAELMPRLQAI